MRGTGRSADATSRGTTDTRTTPRLFLILRSYSFVQHDLGEGVGRQGLQQV
jgi:hypothetical protein